MGAYKWNQVSIGKAFFSFCTYKVLALGVFFLPPSDAYVRSFLYLLYTLIKLYYTHTHTHTQNKVLALSNLPVPEIRY